MEMKETRDDKDSASSCEPSIAQYEDQHTEPGVSTNAKQLIPGVFAQDGEAVENTHKQSQTLNKHHMEVCEREVDNLQVPNTRHSKQEYDLIKLPLPCQCRATIVKPFKCGLCCKVFSTICQLHDHLEYSHRETEMYLFDKITGTAFPRYESASVTTQTDTEIQQHEDDVVDTTEDEFVDAGEFLDSAQKLDEKEQSDRNPKELGKSTESNYCRLLADDSEVLNANKYVVVKTEVLSTEVRNAVLSTENQCTPPSEKPNKLNSKIKKKSGPYSFKRKTGKGKGCKMVKTLTIKPRRLAGDEGCLAKCRQCPVEFNSKSLLKLHVKEVHMRETFCKICQKQYSSRKGLMQHLVVHESPDSCRCHKCDRIYASIYDLKRHIIDIHSDVRDVICQNCGKGFATKSGLHKHHRKCLDIRTHTCSFENCDLKFRTGDDLRAHMSSHTGVMPFICDICGRGFGRHNSLKKHMFTHSGERPMKCDQCPQAFPTRERLTRHMRTHAQDKPLKCHCGKAFTNQWNLKAHARQHTGEKPYVCELCGAQFTHNVSRKNHMKAHTGGAPVTPFLHRPF